MNLVLERDIEACNQCNYTFSILVQNIQTDQEDAINMLSYFHTSMAFVSPMSFMSCYS